MTKLPIFPTPLIADACLRLSIPIHMAPVGIKPLIPDSLIAGRVLPVRHYGSVDVFLESLYHAQPGDVMVIDNGDRRDEGCIGDLTVLEMQANQLAGVIVWGVHRDTTELRKLGFPVFSYGAYACGPQRLDKRESVALQIARIGDLLVTNHDYVIADDDGVIFIPLDRVEEVHVVAEQIHQTEREQKQRLSNGETLRQQFQFDAYLKQRSKDYNFRQHLRNIGGEIEE